MVDSPDAVLNYGSTSFYWSLGQQRTISCLCDIGQDYRLFFHSGLSSIFTHNIVQDTLTFSTAKRNDQMYKYYL